LGILATIVSLAPPSAAAEKEAASASAVADRVMQALGGKEAWDATRFLKFTFVGRRTHWWDKWTGRHRIEGTTTEGQRFVVLENINTHQGRAWVDGKEVAGAEAKTWLERAHGAWVNDTYWLLMPYKLRDPGVNLAYAGQETVDGQTCDKLALSFGKVGLTPGDRYWVYVNRKTGLVDRWAYILQDQPKGGPATIWKWEGWQRFGGIMLAPHRVKVGAEGTLELTDIAAPASLPDAVFESPAPVG
jgi:hypothetical protein